MRCFVTRTGVASVTLLAGAGLAVAGCSGSTPHASAPSCSAKQAGAASTVPASSASPGVRPARLRAAGLRLMPRRVADPAGCNPGVNQLDAVTEPLTGQRPRHTTRCHDEAAALFSALTSAGPARHRPQARVQIPSGRLPVITAISWPPAAPGCHQSVIAWREPPDGELGDPGEQPHRPTAAEIGDRPNERPANWSSGHCGRKR
jgi:hypothetical protein